jgi:hypothetical protein
MDFPCPPILDFIPADADNIALGEVTLASFAINIALAQPGSADCWTE